jgi:hypothetical protein
MHGDKKPVSKWSLGGGRGRGRGSGGGVREGRRRIKRRRTGLRLK